MYRPTCCHWANKSMTQRILVWDLPTRIFHWALVLSFAFAFITGESERWRDIHVLLGYTVAGLIAFRLVWGFIGTRYSRFAEFVRSPVYVIRHLAELFRERAEHPVGHNPAGAIAILLLLLLGIACCVSGWAVFEDIGGDWLEELHELTANAMLALVFAHIVGVLLSSYLQGENLIVAMITGKKRGAAHQAISGSYPLIALLLLAALIVFWIGAWPEGKDASWFRDIGSWLKIGLGFRNQYTYIGLLSRLHLRILNAFYHTRIIFNHLFQKQNNGIDFMLYIVDKIMVLEVFRHIKRQAHIDRIAAHNYHNQCGGLQHQASEMGAHFAERHADKQHGGQGTRAEGQH